MGAHILLLEDDPFCLGFLEAALMAGGYDVVVCDSPEHVIERARANIGTVALVDSWGRSQSVLSAEDRGQLVALAAQVPTILVSARHWANVCTAADLGVMAIILKPFGLTEFYEVIARSVARVNVPPTWSDLTDIADHCVSGYCPLREQSTA